MKMVSLFKKKATKKIQKFALFGIISGTKLINSSQVSRTLRGPWTNTLFSPTNVRQKREEHDSSSNGFRELAGMMLFLQGAAENDTEGLEL